jgi:hypothetical protein
MSDARAQSKRRGFWPRLVCWVRNLAIVATAVAVLVAAGVWWLTQPKRLAGFIEAYLADELAPAVTIDRAHLRWDGTVTLNGVHLTVPKAPKPARRLFEAKRLTLTLDQAALWAGAVRWRRVHVREPVVHLIQDRASGRFNYEYLPTQQGGSRSFAGSLPAISLPRGIIQFGEVVDRQYNRVERLQLAGLLKPIDRAAKRYQLQLRQAPGFIDRGAKEPAPTALSATLDLQAATVDMTLKRFRFQGPQRNLLPARFRRWWDRLEPSGSLPTVNVQIEPGPDGTLQLQRAAVRVNQLALTIPPQALPQESNYTPRMHSVDGRFVLTPDGIRIADVTGAIEGVRYHMDGRVQGFSPDAAFTLEAKTNAFTVPGDPPYLLAMPEVVREQYGHFEPQGRFRAEVRLHRAQASGPVQYDGLVEVLGASMRFHKFPYPLHKIHGKLHFNNERVRANLLGEGPGGAQLRVHGLRIAPPRDGGGSNMTIVAEDVPINEALMQAMEPRHRKAMKLFFSRSGRDQLLQRGVIAQSQSQSVQAPARDEPVHAASSKRSRLPLADQAVSLGGRLPYVRIDFHRPVGEGKEPVVVTTLGTRGVRGLFEHWPYPMISTGGQLVIRKGRVDVQSLTLRSPTEGRGTIDGYVLTPDKHGRGKLAPHLKLKDIRLPVDALLAASLPSPQNKWLKRLHIDGTLQAAGRIFRREDGEIDFKIEGALENGTARPYAGDYTLRQVEGELSLTRGKLELNDVSGQRGASRLTIDGDARWARAGVGLDLRLSAQNLRCEPALLDLIPKDHAMRKTLKRWHAQCDPTGRFDGRLNLVRAPKDTALQYQLRVRPKRLAFDYQAHRFKLSKLSGEVAIEPSKVTFDELAGRFDDGRFATSGLVALENREVALSFSGQTNGLSADLRKVLPEAVVNAVQQLQVDGPIHVSAGRLSINQAEGFSLDTDLKLKGVSANPGLPITQLHGQATVEAHRTAGRDWPNLKIQLQADRLRAWDRALGLTRAVLQTADDSRGRLQLRSLIGQFGGGRVVGSGALQMQTGGFHGEVSLHEVALPAITGPETEQAAAENASPKRWERPTAQPNRTGPTHRRDDSSAGRALERTEPTNQPGRVTARLTIADDGDPDTPRRARGAMQIRGGRIYRQPVALALLKTANLSLPMPPRSFDRAAARFLLRGDRVKLSLLRLEAPSVAIVGRGGLDLPSRQLNLTMFSRNPKRLELGMLSEAVNVFKDELVCIEVTGTLDEPEARPVSFQGLRKTWNAVMKGQPIVVEPNEPRPLPFRP